MNGTIEVSVVGGGIAGVTIAFELARRGTAVTLFEQATLPGASGHVGPTDVVRAYGRGGHGSFGRQAAATARSLAAHRHGEGTDPTLEELWPNRFR